MEAEKSRVTAIAQSLAEKVKSDKRPYSTLAWIVKNCAWQYRGATDDEMVLAHLAAINIMKSQGIETCKTKRKPLSNLNKKERKAFRAKAKAYVASLQKYYGLPVQVHRAPVRSDSEGTYVYVTVFRDQAKTAWSRYPLTRKGVEAWEALSSREREVQMLRLAQHIKSPDALLKCNVETIKAKLECLI